MTPTLLSRRDAKKEGSNRYYTGRLCPQGHVCLRIVSNYACWQCERIKVRRQQKENPELWRRNARRWGKENKERKRDNVKRWMVANPDKAKALRKRAAYKWGQNNRDTARAISNRRRARKKEAEGTYTKHDIQDLRIRQLACLCGDSFEKVSATVDHVIPLSRGGSNWPTNLQLLCQPCNDSKGTKLMSEWTIPNRRT